MAQYVVENVVKQGYLKKGTSSASRLSGFFRRNENNKWFVFTIRQGVPFLEYYDSDVDMFTQQPINSFNLTNCQNIKSMGNSNPPTFCVVCPDRVIELVASSRTQMLEWVNEMEACLIRLGVIEKDVSEHVYTVCPAVIRKPRLSKETQEERDAEAQAAVAAALQLVATTASESRPITSGTSSQAASSNLLSPTDSSQRTSPKVSPSHTRSKTVRPSAAPRTHGIAQSSSVRIASPPAVNGEEAPPPLPVRPHIQTGPSRLSSLSDYHPVTGSSNDSDFVSPEVIAQLRQSRKERAAAEAPARGAGQPEGAAASGASSFECATENESYLGAGNSSSRSRSESRKPDLKPKPEALKTSKKSHTLDGSSSSLDLITDSTLSPSSSSSLSPDAFKNISPLSKPTAVVENDYSLLPGEDTGVTADAKTSGCTVDGEEECVHGCASHECGNRNSSHTCVTKPTPRPRRGLSVNTSISDDGTSQSQPVSNGHTVRAVSVDGSGVVSSEASFERLLGDISLGSENTMRVKDNTVRTEKSTDNERRNSGSDNKDKDKKARESQTSKKEEETAGQKPPKDENENFYGLTYDDTPPPTTMAPAPPIPPLPPRHDSLPAKVHVTKLTITSATKTVPVTPDVKDLMTFPSDTANSSVTSTKEGTVEDDSIAVPPLPLPRKKGQNSDSFRKSHPPSAFTSNGPSDIPPQLPRRPSPQRSLTQDDTPPALPSRNSQSFFIKRPQITSMSVSSTKAAEDDTAMLKRSSAGGIESRDSGNNGSASGLSRKMLLDRAHSLHTVVSLKQTQAEILQSEISQSSVCVSLTKLSGHGLALVEWNNSPCIVGWNQKDFPSLHGKLHIGDIILCVNNVKVTSPDQAQKLLKQASTQKIDLVLHRMPYAKVFAIRRSAEGQSLGIKRDGGSGEIIYVDPNGLAAQHGLTQHAPSGSGDGRSNWFLTEINNRPLNLFFKDDEIEHRLAAVGREISIVVQPSDFIHEIRRQFKKLRNYKNFITQ